MLIDFFIAYSVQSWVEQKIQTLSIRGLCHSSFWGSWLRPQWLRMDAVKCDFYLWGTTSCFCFFPLEAGRTSTVASVATMWSKVWSAIWQTDGQPSDFEGAGFVLENNVWTWPLTVDLSPLHCQCLHLFPVCFYRTVLMFSNLIRGRYSRPVE